MWLSLKETECEERQLVANNHCFPISVSPLENLSDLCHLSHKTVSQLHLLSSATELNFGSLTIKFIHHSTFESKNITQKTFSTKNVQH